MVTDDNIIRLSLGTQRLSAHYLFVLSPWEIWAGHLIFVYKGKRNEVLRVITEGKLMERKAFQ